MSVHVWLAVGLVMVFEGVGPMLFPQGWRKMLNGLTTLPDAILRRYGGGLVVAGCVIYYMLRHRWGG